MDKVFLMAYSKLLNEKFGGGKLMSYLKFKKGGEYGLG